MRAADWVERERYELRPDARRFEEWEQNYAAKLGLAAAIDYALDWGIDAVSERVRALADELRSRLDELPGVKVRDLGRERCGIVTFSADGVEAKDLKAVLACDRINVSVSEPSSTLLDAHERRLPDLVRASVHYYNSGEELDRFVDRLRAAVPAAARS
jgi:selenocysteine lyase/cysteine desulfurase